MYDIGIMQGRLLPPVGQTIQCFPHGHWQEEFARASEAGLACIEWIYDDDDEGGNPLDSPDGIAQILALSRETGVAIRSICADYFMKRRFLRVDAAAQTAAYKRLVHLIPQAASLGCGRIVMPFVDASRIENDAEIEIIVGLLTSALVVAQAHCVELHLETDLAPFAFAHLLDRLPQPHLRVNYDVGNSAALDYAPDAEFASYGERIGSVHIKDRQKGGGTVPLRNGNANFNLVFQLLGEYRYRGDFILQVARGTAGEEVQWAKKNREFVLGHLNAFRERV
jgi:L-ribulose-5-phosphate 3-epimerase